MSETLKNTFVSTKSHTVCQICDYSVNQTNRKLIKCPYCEFDACRTCCETYILGESVVKCMNATCDKQWTRQQIASLFTTTFANGKLKRHREDLLLDNERALLPATQPIVERIIKREEIEKRLAKKSAEINTLVNERNIIQQELYLFNHNQNHAPVVRQEFIKACPDSNCRGFLSTQWKCGLCEQWACSTCHEIKGATKDAEHTCNPETVATVSLLANDTKNCPKCRMGIYKINGCDQMWCTQCQTAFNWRTGRIEATVHNPHYFEWLRRNGNTVPRDPGDIPCRNDLTHTTFVDLRRLLNTRHTQTAETKACEEYMMKLIRNTIHMRYVILPANPERDRVRVNEELRIDFMRNRISEDQFKILLQRNDKKHSKKGEIHDILQVLLNTITDIVFRFYDHVRLSVRDTWNMTIMEEVNPIVDYANECLGYISKAYSSKKISFTYEMQMK
jgi:hypothetical protein